MTTKPLDETLQSLLEEAKGQPISLKNFVTSLKGRGMPIFLILLSFPFCLPIQIPGVSTPFGLAIAFMGFRIFLNKRLWWPHWLLKREISYSALEKLTRAVTKWFKKTQKLLQPRLLWLTQTPMLHRMHGLFVFVMALLLAIPFPVPLTNLLSAYPILFMGFGLLEDDGYMVILSYFIGLISLLFWASLFIFGKIGFEKILSILL